jgi:hypothetical protein
MVRNRWRAHIRDAYAAATESPAPLEPELLSDQLRSGICDDIDFSVMRPIYGDPSPFGVAENRTNEWCDAFWPRTDSLTAKFSAQGDRSCTFRGLSHRGAG